MLAKGTDGTPAAGRWKPWKVSGISVETMGRRQRRFTVGLILISSGLNLILISGGLNLILISGGFDWLILILISGGLILILIRWVDIDFPKPEQTVLKEAEEEEEEEVIILHFLCDNSSVCDNSAFV
jgi:hypothetical protein